VTRHAKASSAGSNPGTLARATFLPLRAAFVACLGLTLFAALFASPAFAVKTHPYTGVSFGPDGTAASSFGQIQSIAIDPATKDVYVYDGGGSGSIYKFNAAHEPVKFSGLADNAIREVGGSGGAENQVAIAPAASPGGTAGDIYVANNSVILIYAPSGEKIGELTGGENCGVATDPAGHVFAGVYREEVREFVPSSNPATNADQKNVSNGKADRVCNVSVDGLGNIYASSYEGSVIVKLAGIGDSSGTRIEPGAPTTGIDPATNDLYADRGEVVAQYSSAGALIGTFGSGRLTFSRGVAINGTSGDVYVGNGANGKVDVFGPLALLPDAETKAASAIKRTSATLNGMIGAAGGPQASCEFQYTTEAHFESEGFQGATSSTCNPAGPFSGSSTQAVKADISGLEPATNYRFRLVATSENGSNPGATLSFTTFGAVNVKTGTASAVSPNSATLSATINPEGVELEECLFEFGDQGELDQTQPCAETPAQIGSGETAVPVHASLAGLSPNTFYSFRIAASNSLGETKGEVRTFETLGPPTITEQTVSRVTVNAATITAFVNPHGQATGFQLEYVSQADFEASGYAKAAKVPASPAEVGEGIGPVEVTQEITGLSEATAYRARVVASNASATVQGPDAQFTTYPTSTGLPEGRAYEMVSPAVKIGEVFPPEPGESGSNTCGLEFCNPGLDDEMMPVQVAPDGNSLVYEGQPFYEGLAPQGNQYLSQRSSGGWSTRSTTPPKALKNGSGYKGYSPDLSRGVLLQSRPALSPEVPEGENEVHKITSYSDLYLWEEGNPDLRPLVTDTPPNRVPGESGGNTFRLSFGGGNSGSPESPAFGHIVFEANDALTQAVPGIAPAAPEAEAGECGDNVNFNGTGSESCNIYEWVEGQLHLVNVLPGNATAMQHAVIGSGRQLAVGIPEYQTVDTDNAISADGSRIFWSDNDGQVYVRIDGEETVEIKDPGHFITATPDGSKVILSDGCVYSLGSESCETTLGNDPNAFAGIAGASEDFSRIYFVDREVLAPGAQAGPCSGEGSGGSEPEGCNLYVFDHGEVTFIASLATRDDEIRGLGGTFGAWKATSSIRSAQVSADGRYLAFMSLRSLTGYDNRLAGGGACAFGPSCPEIYQYDLESHRLSCASCDPSGLRPLGKSTFAYSRTTPGGPFPQLRSLPTEGEGQVFFESTDVLSPTDHNGRVQDVYEWRPSGVGGCALTTGCISLLSGGEGPSDSFFLSSSPSGGDAFFITREQLVLKDSDDLLDVYDVRVNGGINENVAPPCLGEACKGPATSAAEQQSAGSAQFSGPGNEKPHKKKSHKHKKKSKKHKHKSKKKAHKRAAKSNRGGQK
jgi:hypothetical protein